MRSLDDQDGTDRADRTTSHEATWIERVTSWSGIATIVPLTLLLAWTATYATGGARSVADQLFYVPVLLAAVRLGTGLTLGTALAASILAGPLMPLDVDTWTAQDPAAWLARAAFLLGFAAVATLATRRLSRSLRSELDATREQHRLAVQRTEIIQTVSHELRTPLTVIRGVTATLDRPQLDLDTARPLIASLARASRRLDDLLRVVLAAAEAMEADAGDRRQPQVPVSLTELLATVKASLPDLAGPDRVRIVVSGDAEQLVTVPAYLHIVLFCLVENALKFSPNNEVVEIRATRPGDGVVIAVRDRGAGIDPRFADDAFEPFTQHDQTTTRTRGGLGMGLYTARQLAERLGGSIRLQPAPGQGTEARLWLPQLRDADRALGRVQPAADASSTHSTA